MAIAENSDLLQRCRAEIQTGVQRIMFVCARRTHKTRTCDDLRNEFPNWTVLDDAEIAQFPETNSPVIGLFTPREHNDGDEAIFQSADVIVRHGLLDPETFLE